MTPWCFYWQKCFHQVLRSTSLLHPFFLPFPWKLNFWSFFSHFSPLVLAYGQSFDPVSTINDQYVITECCCNDIGCPKKKYSIKLKKKCTKKWRSPTRELKTWYVCNNIIVFLFMKKYFSILNFYGWYGHLNVKFWQFWHWPNVSKFCSKIVLCLLFLLQKKFPV